MLRLTFFSSSVALALGQECGGGEDVCLVQTGGVLSTDGGADSEALLAESLGLSDKQTTGVLAQVLADNPMEETADISVDDLSSLLQASSSSAGNSPYWGNSPYGAHQFYTFGAGSGNTGYGGGSTTSAWLNALWDMLDPTDSDACSFELEVTPTNKKQFDAKDCRSWETSTAGQLPGKCPQLDSLPEFFTLQPPQAPWIGFWGTFARATLETYCDKISRNSLTMYGSNLWQMQAVWVDGVHVGWLGTNSGGATSHFYPMYVGGASRLEMID